MSKHQKANMPCDTCGIPYLMELTSQPLPTAALQMAEPASSYVSFATTTDKVFIRDTHQGNHSLQLRADGGRTC